MAKHLEIIQGNRAAGKQEQSDACIGSAEREQARPKVKADMYAALLPQIESVLEGEPDLIARMANVAAILHETFRFWWTGFYRVVDDGYSGISGMSRMSGTSGISRISGFSGFSGTSGFPGPSVQSQLVLGPFQGPLACTRIRKGRGVCGTAWAEDKTQIVPDVEKFPGHIACSSASRSEIVVPVHDSEGRVVAVLDIDSDRLATFDETDKHWLEQIVKLI